MTSNTKQDTITKVKGTEWVNQSGSTRRRGCISVFSLLREYVSLEGYELHLARLTQRHTCLTLFSDELHHVGLVHLPLLESFEAESGAFTKGLRHTHPQPNWGHSNTPRICYKNNTSKQMEDLGFLCKETLDTRSLKWMRGKWRTAWGRCRSRPSPSILQGSTSLVGGIGRDLAFGEFNNGVLNVWTS